MSKLFIKSLGFVVGIVLLATISSSYSIKQTHERNPQKANPKKSAKPYTPDNLGTYAKNQ